jgi:YbgC/YbaW family acyl-CoA thioester hydrolase
MTLILSMVSLIQTEVIQETDFALLICKSLCFFKSIFLQKTVTISTCHMVLSVVLESGQDCVKSISKTEQEGIMLPVTKYEIDFLLPAKYDDLLIIDTRLTQIKGPQIFFEYEIRCQDKLVARAFTSLVFVDKSSMKPIRPPKSFVDLVQRFETKQ